MLPYYGNVTIFMYNKDLIDKYNDGVVPETWQGVLELSQKMKADGVDGYILRQGAGDPNVTDFLPVLKAFGGWVLNDDFTQVTLNTPEAKAALEFYIDLYKAGNLLDKDNMVAAVNNGSAAMAVGWPGWGAANYTVIPTKVNEDSEEEYTSIYGCWFLGMAENSTKKDLALKFLQYAMDPEVQLATVADGGVPCRESSLLAESSLAIKPNLKVVYGALSTGTYRPAVAFYTDLVNTFGPYLDSAVMGTMSVDDALAQGQAACEVLVP
jgi:ABC-type glycerol-3-phosphate transport system substrate-binding protein